MDEKILAKSCQDPPAPSLFALPAGNENLRGGQRTKEGTRHGRASLVKAQKYIFEIGEESERRRKEGRGSRVFYPTTCGYLFGKQTDRWTDNDAHRSMDKSVYCVNTRAGPDPGGCFAYGAVGKVRSEGARREIRDIRAQHPPLEIAGINRAARERARGDAFSFFIPPRIIVAGG